MLNWKVVTLSVSSFAAITFVGCVAAGLVLPATLHNSRVLEAVLPGFHWLTLPSFVLGVVETAVYGAYVGVLFTVIYNAVARRLEKTETVQRSDVRAA